MNKKTFVKFLSAALLVSMLTSSTGCSLDESKRARQNLTEAVNDDIDTQILSIQKVGLLKDEQAIYFCGHYDTGFNHVAGYINHKDYSIKYELSKDEHADLAKFITDNTIVSSLNEEQLNKLYYIVNSRDAISIKEIEDISAGDHNIEFCN